MPKAQVNDDIELYYETRGGGDPLVLIPGLGVGMWVWFKQIPEFSQRFRTIALDNRGAGQSDKPTEPYTIRMLADDVAGLLSLLGVERAHILGASMGGFIAQEFALSYPQMTRSLILCCTSSGRTDRAPPPADSPQALELIKGLNTEKRARERLRLMFAPEYPSHHPDEVEQIIRWRLANPIPEFAYLNQVRASMQFNATARLSAINVPCLVITGDRDLMVPPESSRRLAAAISNAKLAMIEGAGHSVFIERAEAFNRAVIEFLEGEGRT